MKITCPWSHRQEGCLGRKDAVRPHPPDPNVLVLGDIRRLLSRTTSIDEAGDARGGRKGGVWNVRAPKVVSGVIKTPQQVLNSSSMLYVYSTIFADFRLHCEPGEVLLFFQGKL